LAEKNKLFFRSLANSTCNETQLVSIYHPIS